MGTTENKRPFTLSSGIVTEEVKEMWCPNCGHRMVKARYYEPEGTVPMVILEGPDGEGWTCLYCKPEEGIKQEVKGNGTNRIPDRAV